VILSRPRRGYAHLRARPRGALLTAINGFPSHWYSGLVATPAAADPTRSIQGIMTGIGFLGGGVIIKDGFNMCGISTAACRASSRNA
jgi:uncharacterized membrane protein YhiD involved in acid resistance